MKKTVYIASPYTKGDVAVNVRNSFTAYLELAKLGYVPYSPLGSHFIHFLAPQPYEFWMEQDIEWVLRCDCLLRLPGESSGADTEEITAFREGIPVFYSIEDLVKYWSSHEM